jgi:glycosyltransferase involved in cell wall biosynthesis
MTPDSVPPTPRLSVVVPLFNERDNVLPLIEATRLALKEQGAWELVLVDDGSTDGTSDRVRDLASGDPRIRLIRLGRNYGQTMALQAGFDHCRGRIVVSMDGDLQNDPADISLLVRTLEEDDFDLVAGYRVERRESVRRRFPSAVANAMVRALTGVKVRDTGCTLRAYRRELLDDFVIYSDLHRFIPAVAVSLRGARITELPVRHQPRIHGVSKYGFRRIHEVFFDLLVLLLLRSFRERPLQLFARVAGLCVIAAVLSGIPALVERLKPGSGISLILPALPIIWVELACFLVLLGLIAEVMLRRHRAGRRGATMLVRGIS